MIKLWAKLIKNHKIVKQFVYEKQEKFKDDNFHDYVMEICHKFDLETPILLKHHLSNLQEFRSVKFIKDDFLDDFEFDKFVLEDIA